MNKRQIGSSDLLVNETGFGSMGLSIELKRPSEEKAIALLRRAVDDFGVELIDTADAYGLDHTDMGHGERLIAKALRGERRQRVVIATKGGFTRPDGKWIPNGAPAYLRSACERSLRALGTDRIDLYQLHRPDPNIPIEESLGALVDLQREGKIRHIGVSNFTREQLEQGLRVATIVSLQNPLGFMYYGEEQADLLKLCEEKGIAWIAYAPLGGYKNPGYLDDFSDWMAANLPGRDASLHAIALAWVLRRSPVTIPIPATTSIDHLATNMQASTIDLTDDEVARLAHARSSKDMIWEAMQRRDVPLAMELLGKELAKNPGDSGTWYNLACVQAMAGKTDHAINALKSAMVHGFDDIDHIRHDDDLAPLRGDIRFEELLGGE